MIFLHWDDTGTMKRVSLSNAPLLNSIFYCQSNRRRYTHTNTHQIKRFLWCCEIRELTFCLWSSGRSRTLSVKNCSRKIRRGWNSKWNWTLGFFFENFSWRKADNLWMCDISAMSIELEANENHWHLQIFFQLVFIFGCGCCSHNNWSSHPQNVQSLACSRIWSSFTLQKTAAS